MEKLVKDNFRIFIGCFKHIQAWGIVDDHFEVNVYSKWYLRKPKIPATFNNIPIIVNKVKKARFLS